MSKEPRRPDKPSYGNDPYDCLEPEDMQPDTWYAFTINPSNKKQFFEHGIKDFYKDGLIMDYQKAASNRLTAQLNETKKQLNKMYNIQYDLRLELSHKGRIHYHGYIKVKDVKIFYLIDIVQLQELFTYSIKDIKDPEIWDQYIKKQDPQYRIQSTHPVTKEKSSYDLKLEVQQYDYFLNYDEKQVIRNMLRINDYEEELQDYWDNIYHEQIEIPLKKKLEKREERKYFNEQNELNYYANKIRRLHPYFSSLKYS